MPDIKPLPDDAEPIGIDAAHPPQPTTSSPTGGQTPKPVAPAPGATDSQLGPKLLDAFDDDADFSKDPEVEAARKGKPAAPSRPRPVQPDAPADATQPDPFITPALGPAKFWLILGGMLLLAATIASSVHASRPFVSALLTVYNGLLHTATGVGAIVVAATLARKPIGPWDLGAARMLAAVAAFLVLFNLNIQLVGNAKWEETILAALAYLGVVGLTFRQTREVHLTLVISHFFLWLIIQLGSQLAVWSAANPAPATP
ncbi:MAG: hypothetical protein IT434_05440 [Phycisphaerales bacterium]|jgi:hypothetical protein|nr:hypothetical protein [Phycisphaerales bacterium]